MAFYKLLFKKCAVYCLTVLIFIPHLYFSQDHTNWSYNLGMYEVNVRQYTPQGTFAAFESHLPRIKEMGVGILWLMPVNPIGVKNRLGSLGSYYSVKNYTDVNPEFGNLDDFKSLVNKVHDMGMYVIIDWVANHTSWDNSLTVLHPDWYTQDANGNFIPPAGTDWSDVIDLNYDKVELRDYMTDAMKFWISETGIDGFRCDAASMVPLDFWSSAISELKNVKPDILMLAEADGAEYYNAGFDMTFAWGLYGFGSGVFTKITNGSYNANYLASLLRGELSKFTDNRYRLYFTSNHDENSWYGTVFERFGAAAEPFAAITLTMNSMPLIYSGQEAGLNKRLRFFDKDQINWKVHPFNEVYTKLLELKRNNKALWNGTAGANAVRVSTTNNPGIFAFVREKDDDKVFALFNVTAVEQSFTPQGDLYPGNYLNVFTGDSTTFETGTLVTLPAWGYSVYSYSSTVTGISKNEIIQPYEFILKQNYPNPFNPTTSIQYSIPPLEGVRGDFAMVRLVIYDIMGSEVTTLVDGHRTAGTYEVLFDGSKLSSGVYYYSLRAGKVTLTKKLLLLK